MNRSVLALLEVPYLGLPGRFWEKVIYPAVEGTSCWLWSAAKRNGYGYFDRQYAHRLVLSAVLGRPLTPGMDVMHSCDVRNCVNPAHLSEGTRQENMRDCWSKGRASPPPRNGFVPPPRKGGDHHAARLTEDEVREIRLSTAKGSELAVKYGVTQTTISGIRRRRRWRHVP
ncbi:MAG: HNH endonuclease [Frankia sp.]|nr:HNH endonuclease [Frankia sp.]